MNEPITKEKAYQICEQLGGCVFKQRQLALEDTIRDIRAELTKARETIVMVHKFSGENRVLHIVLDYLNQ